MRGNLRMRWSMPREELRRRGEERAVDLDTGNRRPGTHRPTASWTVD